MANKSTLGIGVISLGWMGRLHSRSYGRFIIQSMPEFWRTCDLDVVTGALERLNAELHED